jgi:hypothetical protein
MPRWLTAALCSISLSATGAPPGPDVAPFIVISAPSVALRHVNVIDGTGGPARPDQTLVLVDGRITAIGPASSTPIPAGAEVHDYPGHSVLPGLVGLHNHLYYVASGLLQRASGRVLEPGILLAETSYSAPRLYLAAGVTTLRTTGSLAPYADLKVRSRIDAGLMPGPKLDLTAPYLEGPPTQFAEMPELTSAEQARRFVSFWADSGMTSFKAYMHISRAALAASIGEAHRRGLKLTGHLCSVTWPEAVEAGIDNLEHGPVVGDSEFVVGKKPDLCPDRKEIDAAWLATPMDGPKVAALIALLVEHRVAVTSTLPVLEASVAGRQPAQRRVLDVMSSAARESYLSIRAMLDPADTSRAQLFAKEMQFERAFAAAGGLLLTGPDPTGNGGVVPGFGDQRGVELLVEAGFTPLEAIQVATLNGARFLGRLKDTGTVERGKQADLVLVKGDPSARISDIENVQLVFKDGIGYDSARLIDSVRGQVGIR